MDADVHRYLNTISIVLSNPDLIVDRHWERTVKQKKLLLSLR
jgi:hypothetical protein